MWNIAQREGNETMRSRQISVKVRAAWVTASRQEIVAGVAWSPLLCRTLMTN
jgi:hypothetical protein